MSPESRYRTILHKHITINPSKALRAQYQIVEKLIKKLYLLHLHAFQDLLPFFFLLRQQLHNMLMTQLLIL